METDNNTKTNSERSIDEKLVGGTEAVEAAGLPPDPDAHLSAQEKAAIVS